jgi:diguanylate cyclase (GGDEF)-like protein
VQTQWQGSFVMTSPEDGVTRTVSFRRLITFPLVVLIGFDQADVLQHYLDARRHALLTGIIITAIALLLGSFWIDQRRRWLVSSRSLRVTLENMNQGIVMIDSGGRAPVVNRRAVELLHLPDDMIAQPGMRQILPWQADQSGRLSADHAALLMPPGTPPDDLDRSAVFENVDGDGKIIEVQTHAVPTGGMVLTYTDVTDRRLAEARIRHLAHHDALTGLPNRVLLNERIAEAISRAKADESLFAVLCLDLDGFKGVNDTMGHDAGDLLLVRFAERLRVAVRPTDTVARTGGDEFAIVLRDLAAPDDAERLIGRLLETLVEPVRIEGFQFAVATSIGVAVYPRDGLEARSLMKNADTALYRAKAEGRGTYRFFEPSMDEQLKEKRAIEQDLRSALERDELEVYFQPQFACDTLVVVGFEALIRWNHPTRGFVPPGIFIPIAEECGLIVAVGRVALQKACAYASQWRPRYRIAVNLSPIQFRDERLAALLDDTLQRTGLPADLLELEVTEGVLIGDEAQALSILHDLKGRGLRIALDDFGTGYSSLSYLRRFPFDKIKIDKSFVQAQQYDPGSQAIMEAVLTMSARLNLDVTVEGVETDEQLTMVQRQRCSEVQGFLLGRPMPAADVPRFLEFEARVPDGWDAAPHPLMPAHAEPEPADTVSDAAD